MIKTKNKLMLEVEKWLASVGKIGSCPIEILIFSYDKLNRKGAINE